MFTYFKELITGSILIILGVFGFIVMIDSLRDWMLESGFLTALLPGNWLFNIILILLGLLVLVKRIALRTTH